MKSFFVKIFILAAFLVFIIFVLIKNLNNFNKNKYETITATICTVEEKAQANGIIYKDEKTFDLSQNSQNNIVKTIYKDGTKIAKNSVIAKIYKKKEDSLKHETLNSLKEELKNLEELKNKDLSRNFDLIALEKQLYSNYNILLKNIKKKEIGKIEDIKKTIHSLLTTKQLAINKNINFNPEIKTTKEEIEKIESSIEKPKDILAQEAGYFVAKTDGLEDKCSIEKINDLNYHEFNKFLNNLNEYKKEENKKAKILTSSSVLFKAFLPTKILINKKINSEYKMKFKENNFLITVFLKEIYLNIKEKNSLAIFEIFDINEALAINRKCKANIVFKEYDAFKIPKNAVSFNNSKKPYVFIINGDFIKIRNVEIIAEDENFYICSSKQKNLKEDLNYLKNLDKIIVKGKNLYDNKKI